MTIPVYGETWLAPPDPLATVPAGAGLPAGPGAVETWTMAGNYAAYPLASPAARPPALFRVYDPDEPREQITVTDTRAAPAWTVRRAFEASRTDLTHKPGFKVRPFLTKAGLNGRAAGTPSRTGLVMPRSLSSTAATPPFTFPSAPAAGP